MPFRFWMHSYFMLSALSIILQFCISYIYTEIELSELKIYINVIQIY